MKDIHADCWLRKCGHLHFMGLTRIVKGTVTALFRCDKIHRQQVVLYDRDEFACDFYEEGKR